MPLYPSVAESKPEDENFRLSDIRDMGKFIESEIDKYSKCKRKYSTAFRYLNNTGNGLQVLAVSTSGVGIGLIAGGVAAVPGIALEGLSIGMSAIGFVCSLICKKLLHKVQKHDKLVVLSSSKLALLKQKISKALTDNKISHEEYVEIIQICEDYKKEKKELHQKTVEPVDTEELKKSLWKWDAVWRKKI